MGHGSEAEGQTTQVRSFAAFPEPIKYFIMSNAFGYE